MIRVLHFVSTPAICSGVMSVIMNYYRHIDRTQIQFDFLCFLRNDENYEQEIHLLGGNVYYIRKPGTSMRSLKELNDFFKLHAGKYLWFHNHEVYLSFYLEPLTRKYGIKNFIIHSHATQYSDRWMNAKRNQIFCLPIRNMKCEKVACSKAAADFLYGTKFKRIGNKPFVLHNAIEVEKYKFCLEVRKEIRQQLKIDGKIVVGNVGRFEKQKNHRFLVESFQYFHEQKKESVLILIGSGSLMETVKQSVIDSHLEDSVLFLGQCNDVWKYYQAMDQFWLPSLYEGLPMSAVEAQASGLPCVIADTVTTEVSILESTIFLNLDCGPEKWGEKALNLTTSIHRESGEDKIIKAGFDVIHESMRLEQFYKDKG